MVHKNSPRNRARREARREVLLAAAVRIFGEKGYHATTVPEIVGAADSSIGVFYSHFRHKEDIFEAVLGVISAEVAETLNGAIAKSTNDTFAQMKSAVEAFVEYLSTHPAHARILIVESAGLGDQLAAVHRQIIDSHTRSVAAALTAARAQLGPLDPTIAATCWVGAVNEAVFQWLRTPAAARRSLATLSHDIALFNLRAVGAPVDRLFEEGNHADQ